MDSRTDAPASLRKASQARWSHDQQGLGAHLYLPLRAYVERATELLVVYGRDRPDEFHALDWPMWHRDADGTFRQSGTTIVWSAAIDAALEAMPERQKATDSLAADPAVRAQLDALVGTARSGMSLRTSSLLNGLVRSSWSPGGQFEFRSELFDAQVTQLAQWLYSDHIETVTIVPLQGLSGDTVTSIEFSARTELARLSDEELARALSVGAIRPLGGVPIYTNDPAVWGLRIRSKMAKLVGSPAWESNQHAEELRSFDNEVSAAIDQSLAALHIFKKGQLAVLPTQVVDGRPTDRRLSGE